MKKLSFLVVLCGLLLLQPVFLLAQGGQGFPGATGSSGNSPFGSSSSTGSSNSPFGDALSRMDSSMNAQDNTATPADEYYLGRAVAANILAAYKQYNGNQKLTAYLNNICQTLVINSSRPEIYNGYHLIILDSQEYNAFATPGGHIFVTRGLLSTATSEDALAGIIAHEIAHIILKHSISIIDDMKITEEMSAAANRAAAFQGSAGAQKALSFRNSVSDVVNTMIKSGYSKPQEFEADANAVAIMAAAGYDPNGLLDMLKTLQKVQSSQKGGFNSTHPTPAERISSVQPVVNRNRVADTKSFRVKRFINK